MSKKDPEIRTLSRLMPRCHANYDLTSGAWEIDLEYGGTWEQIAPVIDTTMSFSFSPALIHSAQIDLTGLEGEGKDLTFFPQGFSMQEPGFYSFTSSINQFMSVFDVISTAPISNQTLANMASHNSAVGMSDMPGQWDRISFGKQRLMSAITAGPGSPAMSNVMYTQNQGLFGSGEPSAVSRLYCYRVVATGLPDDNSRLTIPASRFIIGGVIVKEDELVHLDRMYRSYNSQS